MGCVLDSQGKPREAIAAYKSLAIKPDYADAHYNLGNTHQSQGKLEEAIAAYKNALEINPNYSNASAEVGHCMLKIGKFEEGRSLIKKTEGSISL